ncbi:homeobox protein 2-like [Tetranychus urticae]|uniref:homeobox protein 2-like n=1 Tax=Tetranychus urticae TaxID=32264 RepID=UPI00077BC0A1|nr:homeobox protein 2-like [Tetranychus urticae]
MFGLSYVWIIISICNLDSFIVLVESSPDKFSVYPQSDLHQPFSTVETKTGTKLSPNGAAIRQWETRSWISTIPLQKAVTVDNSNALKNAIPKHYNDLDTGLASTTLSTTSVSHDDQFDFSESKYSSSSFRDNDPRDPRNYPIISTSNNITHHSPSAESRSRSTESECKGDSCRKSPFQGTYDTINYQKKIVYPEKQSSRVEEPNYPRRFRGEDNYNDEGGRPHHSRYHHHSSEIIDHNNEKDSRHPATPHHLTWQHHAHPKGRSSRWESDMSSLGNEHGNEPDEEWNRKDWRDKSMGSNRDSFGYNAKTYRNSMRGNEENDKDDKNKDHSYHQRDHYQTRRRKYNNNDTKDEPRPGGKDHYEYDRREYEKERDREWRNYSNGRNHDNNDNGNSEPSYYNGKSEERWESGKEDHENEGRTDKSTPHEYHSNKSNNKNNHDSNHHHRSYDNNGNDSHRTVKPGKSKPKVKTYHHDEETPDGYSHAHGYEKETVEGSRFFEPSGLAGHDTNDHHNNPPPQHYINDYENSKSHNVSDEYRHNNHYQNGVGSSRQSNNRIHGKNKPECDCSGRNGKGRPIPEVADDASAKSKAAAASAARVKRQDEDVKLIFGTRSGQKLKSNLVNDTKSKR